ncbi:MAG: hypothetical protein ACOCXX_04015, partial [Planctomycetota bacterium]
RYGETNQGRDHQRPWEETVCRAPQKTFLLGRKTLKTPDRPASRKSGKEGGNPDFHLVLSVSRSGVFKIPSTFPTDFTM